MTPPKNKPGAGAAKAQPERKEWEEIFARLRGLSEEGRRVHRLCLSLLQLGVQLVESDKLRMYAPKRTDIIERTLQMLRDRQRQILRNIFPEPSSDALRYMPAVEWHTSALLKTQHDLDRDRQTFVRKFQEKHGTDPNSYSVGIRIQYDRALREFKWRREKAAEVESYRLLQKLRPGLAPGG